MTQDNKPNPGAFLRECRLKADLSIEELSEEIGIHSNTIYALEAGRLLCGELNARRFGEHFDVDWKKFISRGKNVGK